MKCNMTLTMTNLAILLLAIFKTFMLLTNIQAAFGYPEKIFPCGKYRIKCIFPQEACDGEACRNCLPECNKPYKDRMYGCEPFCSRYDEAPSNKESGFNWDIPKVIVGVALVVLLAIVVIAMALLILQGYCSRKWKGTGDTPEEKIGLQTNIKDNDEDAVNEEENTGQQLNNKDNGEVTENEEEKTGIQEEDNRESGGNDKGRIVYQPNEEDKHEFLANKANEIPGTAANSSL